MVCKCVRKSADFDESGLGDKRIVIIINVYITSLLQSYCSALSSDLTSHFERQILFIFKFLELDLR